MMKTGGCHCGAVKFEVEFPDALEVFECNCSICRKSGYLHLIVPAEKFRLVSGMESLSTYAFGTGVAKHYFCKVCGIKSFYVPRSNPDGFSVNLRCLDEENRLEYSIKPFDGQNWEKHAAGLTYLTERTS